MPTNSRLTGRFFSVLIALILATVLPPAAAIGEVGPKNQSSPGPTLCQITDIVYRADGTPAQGTALISWPAFTTAAGQAVAPGSFTVTLDSSGGFNASLAPNTGASPAGTYYRAIFKLDESAARLGILARWRHRQRCCTTTCCPRLRASPPTRW
jgi:hypothetical protein